MRKPIGERILDYRSEALLTQAEMADLLEVNVLSVHRYEHNLSTPHIRNQRRMHKILDRLEAELNGNV
jgi:transcriptional regulator with XRE-family HTH domain